MGYLTPKERMKVSVRRGEVESTGKLFYTDWKSVPKVLVTKTQASKIKKPVQSNEEPIGYVFSRAWNGYLPLYKRE